jgi:hypothetical protein
VVSNVTGQLLITWEWEYNEVVYQQFVDFKKASDLVRRDVFCNILIDFGIPLKLIRLVRNHMSGRFPVKNALKHAGALSTLL